MDKKSFNVTDSSANRIKELLEDEADENTFFRIEVLGGGCSGFQYNFDFDTKEREDDIVFEHLGVKVVIDEQSLEFVSDSTLDYVVTLGSASFSITNPNATANCGCGNSFAV